MTLDDIDMDRARRRAKEIAEAGPVELTRDQERLLRNLFH